MADFLREIGHLFFRLVLHHIALTFVKVTRLDENLGALKVELTLNDLRIAAQIKIEGPRYPQKLAALTGR